MMKELIFLLILLQSYVEAKKVVLISLDGFRHDYIDMALKAGKNVSAFQKIMQQGFRAKVVESVMVSQTFPSHYAIATGRYVDRHGLVGNIFFDKTIGEVYSYKSATNSMQPQWFTMNDNEPIWLTNQRNGGQSCVVYWPGSDSRFYGEMMFTNFGLYSDVPSLRFRIDRLMDWITQDDINFCMLYFNEPDSAGHRYGPDSKEVLNAIEQVNHGIAYLMQRLEESKELIVKPNLIVTSDHGMTSVSNKKVVPVDAVLGPEEYHFGYDGSSSNLGVWPIDDSPAGVDKIYNRLSGLRHCKVYKKEDIPEVYHYKNNERIAPIVVFADLGWMLLTNSSQPYSDTTKGSHGYDNQADDMHPFLVAMGPDIKQEGEIESFHQVDVYPLVCMLLDIFKPNRIDGDVNRVLPRLQTPPSDANLKQFIQYASGSMKPEPETSMASSVSVTWNLLLIMVAQRLF